MPAATPSRTTPNSRSSTRTWGGFLEFTRYDQNGHPYRNIKNGIKQYFFDLEQLSALLQSAGFDPILPNYQVTPGGTGDLSGLYLWYLDNDSNRNLHYELGTINGTPTKLSWDSLQPAPPDTRLVLISFPPGGNPHETYGAWGQPAEEPDPPFPGFPRSPSQQALYQGHMVLEVAANRRPDIWVSLQRAQDMLHYIDSVKTTSRPELIYTRAFAEGASFGAAEADKAALLGPKWCYGSIGTFWNDTGYNMFSGAWGKAVMHLSSALSQHGALVAIPPRVHDPARTGLMAPSVVRAAELTGGWEEGVYSIPMRLALGAEGLQRPIGGLVGNNDIGDNPH
ncbi:MAG: hypothetical protein AB1486_13370 [Planctomycetota bacterium]